MALVEVRNRTWRRGRRRGHDAAQGVVGHGVEENIAPKRRLTRPLPTYFSHGSRRSLLGHVGCVVLPLPIPSAAPWGVGEEAARIEGGGWRRLIGGRASRCGAPRQREGVTVAALLL
jgi:hypothetical protein